MSLRHVSNKTEDGDVESPHKEQQPEEKAEVDITNPIEEYVQVLNDPAKRTKLAKKVRKSFIEYRSIIRAILFILSLVLIAAILFFFGLIGRKSQNGKVYNVDGLTLKQCSQRMVPA